MEPTHFDVVADIDLHHWWFVARRGIMREVLACFVPPGQGCLVVDIGCGPGANIASLAGAYECVGIDTSEDAIRLARGRFDDVKFIRGTAPQDLGELAGRADAYLLMDVLEHVPDDAAVLGAIVPVVKPGGVLLLTVPADMRLWSRHDESLGHYRRYDPARLRKAWEGLPVTELMMSHFNTRLYPGVRAVRALGRLSGRAWGQANTDMRRPGRLGNPLLQRLFAGESRRLVGLARQQRTTGYGYGVSLMAVLRKEPVSDGARTA